MNYLCIDTEFTVGNWKAGQGGDPFDPKNRLCLVGLLSSLDNKPQAYKIEYDLEPFGSNLKIIQEQIDKHSLLVLFNAKRDLHWLRRYGLIFSDKTIWDVQLCHFIHMGQSNPYPSLNEVGEFYNLGQKDDRIETEYFANKIDVDQIPLDVLTPYLERDLILTRDCFLKQETGTTGQQRRLLRLCNIDLLILEEIEWNGLDYDVQGSKEKAEQVRKEICDLDDVLASLVGTSDINWNSTDHCSAVLYGGSIKSSIRVLDGVYKSGKKMGQPKYSIQHVERQFVRLIDPLDKTELEKDGYWSTAETVLRELRPRGKAKTIIECLLKRSKLEKLVGSYFEGIPKQLETMGWGLRIHGTLNQCVAATGRLSSSKPNLQNNPPEINLLFRSRYE